MRAKGSSRFRSCCATARPGPAALRPTTSMVSACRERLDAVAMGPPSHLALRCGEPNRPLVDRRQLIREIRSVQLLNAKLDGSQRRRLLDLERDGKQAAVLKAIGRRARSDDVTGLRVERSDTGGQPALLQEREPAWVVPQMGLETAYRLEARAPGHVRRYRDRSAHVRFQTRDSEGQHRVAPLSIRRRRDASRLLVLASERENRDSERCKNVRPVHVHPLEQLAPPQRAAGCAAADTTVTMAPG